jgi:preprotein translocase subunit SecG
MSTVLLVIHSLIALALIGVVLLQRSEGGALGIGGGGSGGFMTGRGAANLLTRVTAGLAAGFFATSLLLSIIATRSAGPRSVLETVPLPGVSKQAPESESKPSSLPPIDFNLPSGQPPKGGDGDQPKVPQSK